MGEPAELQRHPKRRQHSGEKRPLVLTLLWIFLWLALGVPIVVSVVVVFPVYPLGTGIALAAIALIVGIVVVFWFRCPSCKRLWAGELMRVERRETTGWSTLRDTQGVSQSVMTRQISTVRHYRCRYCKSAFTR